MTHTTSHTILNFFIAAVWIANGLFCKVLDLVPRHGQIVARILGDTYARPLTIAIGISEILMALWVLSSIRSRWNALAQAAIIAAMNILEFILVPDMLMWGRANAIFAIIFIFLVLYNEFMLNPKTEVIS